MEKRIFEMTDGIRGKVGEEPITKPMMRCLGLSIAKYMPDGIILIGRDTRSSGIWIVKEIVAGLKSGGRTVWDVGIISTPGLAQLTRMNDKIISGIMVTASHNPATDNGVKVFDRLGDKITDAQELDIEAIIYSNPKPRRSGLGKVFQKPNLIDDYIEALASIASNVDLTGLRVCIDSAAGGAYGIGRRVFERLGAIVFEVGEEPDGENVNSTGALTPEVVATAVLDRGADLGVSLDADADRIIIVDETGRAWNGDRMLAALAREFQVDRAIATEYSNLGALNYIKSQGISLDKVVVGDREVARLAHELGARLGGEQAGHIIDLNWLSSSDGVMVGIMFATLIRSRGLPLSTLWPDYDDMPQQLWNIQVREKAPLATIEGWVPALMERSQRLGTRGRVFARYSGTEKKLRILVECDDIDLLTDTGESLASIIQREIGL